MADEDLAGDLDTPPCAISTAPPPIRAILSPIEYVGANPRGGLVQRHLSVMLRTPDKCL